MPPLGRHAIRKGAKVKVAILCRCTPVTMGTTDGFFNRLSFGWMNRVVKEGRRGDIALEGLPLPVEQSSEVAYGNFQAQWDAAVKVGKPNLRSVLFKCFGRDLMVAGIFKLGWSVCVIMGAFFFVRSILTFMNNQAPFAGEVNGWILAIFFFIDAWLLGICLQRMGFGCMGVGIRVRAALVNAVCKKSFAMANINKDMASDAVSFVASDISKIFDGCLEIHYLWTAPIEAGAILLILAVLVKVYALPGWGVIAVVLPCQYLFGWLIIKNQVRNAANTQERGGIIQEILPAMKLIKFYAWEQYFEDQISVIRNREMKLQVKNAIVKTINFAMVFATPPTTACVIFAAFEMMSGRLDATLAFTTLSLFNILRFPLVVLPKAMRAASDAVTSMTRIEKFLLEKVDIEERKSSSGPAGIRIRNGRFTHHGKEGFTLNVPEFSVNAGELVAVVGRVGAGKSSLIQAAMGNMSVQAGDVHCAGKISYVPQNPWCQNLSLRDNILFGLPFEEDRYSQVIHDCGLELDLQILPQGDMSKAGLRGINLSGGQRQRLNVARAAYFNGDLVLLDNALSALDHHTAHQVFNDLLKTTMQDKAIVLITHQIEFLTQVDKVAIMDSGDMIYFGPWNAQAQQLLSKVLPTSHLLAAAGGAEERKTAPKKPKAKGATTSNLSLSATNIKDNMGKKAAKPTSLDLGAAMGTYIKFCGIFLFFISFFFFLSAQTTRQLSDVWVRQWTGDSQGWYKGTSSPPILTAGPAYLTIYGLLTALFIVLMLFRGTAFHAWALRGSQSLHKNMLHRVLYAPLGFFLRNPVGEILVAFTKDQDILDGNLVDTLHYLGIYGLIMLATVITVSVTIPMFSIFAGVLFMVTFIMLWFYMPAATKLKKHKVETAGDLVGLVAETLEGLPVIHAFGQNNYFVQTAAYKTDQHHRALFSGECLNLWLAFYCDLYGSILVLAVSVFAVVMRTSLGPSAVGLAFSNTIQMLVFYTWTVRNAADAVSLMSSTEKIGWMATRTPQEGGPVPVGGSKDIDDDTFDLKDVNTKQLAVVTSGATPPNWPARGIVEFDNVWMKYAPSAPYALKGVTFRLGHSEKAGVVGRTGSGKSTCLLALYRMFELDKGTIKVDGVDVATLALKKLRMGLSIIPQEPVVFSGTVRTNLDPFSEFQDPELWETIKKVGLEEQVHQAGGLDGRLDGTGGQAWSLGQQQLVCLCRASLRKVPILCLDEATAAMDPHTEQQVQSIMKRIFTDRTTLTIAHRLDTVIESDYVLVMEAGVLKEMAPPSQLLADRESMFSKLVDKTGPQAAAGLRTMAADFFASRQEGRQ